MSVQALGWVLDHSPAKGADRLVLISIANHAGQHPEGGAWEAWPGIETIAREAGLDRTRTVRDALARLVAAGAVERFVNGAPDERIRKDHRPNLYRIRLDHGGSCDVPRCRWCTGGRDASERGDASRPDGGTRGDRTGGRAASPEPSLEPRKQPSEEPLPLTLVEAGPVRDEFAGFGEFWEAYPRRVARTQARHAWRKAIARASEAEIIAGARRYATEVAGRDPSKIAHPATWLNGDRWDDEPGANAARPPRPGGPRAPQTRRDGPEGRIVG